MENPHVHISKFYVSLRHSGYVCDITTLTFFKNCNIRKLLVTTRDTSVSIELEKQLNVRAYSLGPFSREDILDFCKKFWELNLNLQTKLNKKRVKEFVNAVTETYNVYRYDFISIPLHTEMIARCIQEKFELFYKHKDVRYTRVPDYTLNGYSLFKDFIDIKYDDIYLKDKNKIDPTLPICLLDGGLKESFYNRHKRLALCALFDRDIIDLLSPETFYKLPNDLRTVQHGKERCGFVCRFEDDKPQFTHLSFAEFFVADVIWERFRLISSSQLMTLFEKVLKGYLITNDKQQICIFLQGFAMHEPNNIKDSSAKARFLLRNLTFESGEKTHNCMLSLIESCSAENCSELLQVLDGLSVGEKRAIFTLSAQEGYTNLLRAMNGMIGQAIMKKQKCYFELLSQTKEDENMKTANILVNEHGYGINWTFACNTTCFSGLMKYNSYAMIKSFLNSGFKEFVNPCGKFSLPLYDVLKRTDSPQDLIETLLNATDLTLIEQHFYPKISWFLLSRDQSLTEAFLQKGIDMVQVFLVEQERGVWDGAWSGDYFYYLLSLRWMNQMQLFFENGVGFHTKLLAKVKQINYIFNSILSASETDQNLANVCINALIRSKNAKSFRLVVRSTCFDKTLYINNRAIDVDKFMSRTIFNIETSNFEEIFELLNCKDLPNASQNFNNFISEVLNSNEEVLSFKIIKHICLTHFIDAKDLGELVSKLSTIVPMLEKLHSHYLKLFDAIQTRQQNYVKHELISIQSEMHRKTIINGRSETFGSPLLYVVTTNDTTMAELLLDYGANPSIVLYHEKDQKCDKFTQLFKKYMEYDNITSVHVAACLGNLDIIKLLHAKGANIHPKTSITPLHLAAREGHIEIVRYLLNNDAEADAKTFNYNRSSIAKDEEGRTPLELAQQNGRTDVVTLLKRYQPSLANGFTELHRAAASNDLDELRILVQAGTIAINSRTTYNGYTPLHVGAEHGYAAVVLFLLKNRADKNARSLKGKTPLEIALEKRHNKVADTINFFQLSDFQQSYIPDFRRIKKEEEIYLQKNGDHSCG
ncbi:uncharacterized protein LOC120416934 [Culex pipiens pallens]|uniref:uncharacterized protein LOC120416934 n=1 Tax=Culex pipiens pallens TaxID=42434 RepID=UPI0022AB3607|nr:uncharacterized protein LOC120416934 [Culex pipiens pallens]